MALAGGGVASAAPGSYVGFDWVVTNRGNDRDRVSLQAVNLAGDAGNFDSIEIFADADRNGIPDNGAGPPLETVALAAGESLGIVLRARIPADAASGDDLELALYATGYGGASDNARASARGGRGPRSRSRRGRGRDANCDGDVTDPGDQGVSAASLTAAPGECVLYEIAVQNAGSAEVPDLSLNAATPAGTRYETCEGACPWTLVGGDGTSIALSGNAFLVPPAGAAGSLQVRPGALPGGAGRILSFLVRLDERAPAASVFGFEAFADHADPGRGSVRVRSEPLRLAVAAAGGVVLTAGGSRFVGIGGRVEFAFALTNQSNRVGAFHLVATNSGAGAALDDLSIVADRDLDGQPDNATAIALTPPLAPGAQFGFVVIGATPTDVETGDRFEIAATVTARQDRAVTRSRRSATNGAPALDAFSVAGGPHAVSAAAGDVVQFGWSVSNDGDQPLDIEFLAGDATGDDGDFAVGSMQVLFDLDSDGIADSTTPIRGLTTLPAGEELGVVLRAQIPADAEPDESRTLELAVRGSLAGGKGAFARDIRVSATREKPGRARSRSLANRQ